MRSLVFSALFAIAGSTAFAQCPTRDAMAAGGTAYATYPDSGTVALRWMGAGMIEETTRYPDGGNEFRMISMGGVFIVDEVDLDGVRERRKTRITTRYPQNLYDRLPVKPQSEMAVTAVNSFADGSAAEDEHVVLRSGPLAEIEIGGCKYTGFPMHITYHWGADESFTSMMTFLPSLGIALEVARKDRDMQAVRFSPDRFNLTPP